MGSDTILKRLVKRVEETPEGVVLSHRARSVDWKHLPWIMYAGQANKVARGFIAQGLQPGNAVVILSNRRAEWVICALATMMAGGRVVGLYPSSSSELVGHVVANSEATIVVAENKTQFDKLKQAMARMPNLESIVVIEGAGNNKDLLSWDQLIMRGEGFPQTPLSWRLVEVDSETQAALFYATGESRVPRPVQLSHGALLAAAEGLVDALKIDETDVIFSRLSMAHIVEFLMGLFVPILTGARVWFPKDETTIAADLADCRPTIFVAVPRQWERMAIDLGEHLGGVGGLGDRVRRFASETAESVAEHRERGVKTPAALGVKYRLADGLVYSKAKTHIALERARALISAAAPLAPTTQDFFAKLDMPIWELYGLTEAAGVVATGGPDCHRPGTVGMPINGIEADLTPDGEVLVRGPTLFTGYWNDPRATASVMQDGWLTTGDLGVFDDDGFLRVFDRKEDVIELTSGHRIAPSTIELKLKAIPEVSWAVILGHGLPYVIALLTIHPDLGMKWVREREVNVVSMRELAGNMSFNNYMRAQIDAICEELPRHEVVKSFTILEHDLSVEKQEITPSLKLRREQIYTQHIDAIRKLYGDDWDDGSF